MTYRLTDLRSHVREVFPTPLSPTTSTLTFSMSPILITVCHLITTSAIKLKLLSTLNKYATRTFCHIAHSTG